MCHFLSLLRFITVFSRFISVGHKLKPTPYVIILIVCLCARTRPCNYASRTGLHAHQIEIKNGKCLSDYTQASEAL